MFKKVIPLLLFGAALTACGGTAATPSPTPSPAPTPNEPLLTIESRGGHCIGGACGRTLIVERDGRVHEAAKPPNDLGFVEPDLLVALQQAIDTADWAEIKSHPFTDTCPVAFDGTEIVVDFGTASGTEHIEGCQVAIDWASPPFITIKAALAPWFQN